MLDDSGLPPSDGQALVCLKVGGSGESRNEAGDLCTSPPEARPLPCTLHAGTALAGSRWAGALASRVVLAVFAAAAMGALGAVAAMASSARAGWRGSQQGKQAEHGAGHSASGGQLEEGMQLLASSCGARRDHLPGKTAGQGVRAFGLHAELQQQLVLLLAKQEEQQACQAAASSSTSPAGSLQAALLSGPLQLQLSDITFCRIAPRCGAGSAQALGANSVCSGGSSSCGASSMHRDGSSMPDHNSGGRARSCGDDSCTSCGGNRVGAGSSTSISTVSRSKWDATGSPGGLVELGTGGHSKVSPLHVACCSGGDHCGALCGCCHEHVCCKASQPGPRRLGDTLCQSVVCC